MSLIGFSAKIYLAKMKFNKTYFFGLIVLVMVVWFVLEATTQPGVEDLAGNPEEVTFVRNENNTGPVKRVYIVGIADTLWNVMEKYGSYMPHNKYGNTQVYFFPKDERAPEEITLGNPVPEAYQPYCLGRYEKNAMGSESFVRYPFSR